MSKCSECVNYKADRNRQCIAYNNECEPDDEATHCCEFVKRKEGMKKNGFIKSIE